MPYKDITFSINTGELKASGVRVDSDHTWGFELRLVGTKQYCGKLLVLTGQGHQSSLHYHPVKKETFFVLSGSVKIVMLGIDSGIYNPGDSITLYPGMAHRFSLAEGCNEALILEVSTEHKDEDVVKLEEST